MKQIRLHIRAMDESNGKENVILLRDIENLLQTCQKDIDSLKKKINDQDRAPEEPPRNKRIRELTKELLIAPWCYGLAKILKPNSFLIKAIWTVSFVVSVILCFNVIISNMIDYLSYNTVSQIEAKRNHELALPQLTFCEYHVASFDVDSFDNITFNYELVDDFSFEVKACKFDGKSCSLDYEIVDVYNIVGKKFKCLQFSGGKNLYGNEIELLKQKSANDQSAILHLMISFKNTTGFKIYFINDNYQRPIFEKPTSYLLNKNTHYIKLEKNTEEKLGLPYNNCIDNFDSLVKGSLVEKTIQMNRKYSQSACFSLCYYQSINEEFNCSMPDLLNKTDATRNCYDIDGFQAKVNKYVFIKLDNEKKCSDQCPEECKSTSFVINEVRVPNHLLQGNMFYFTMFYPELKLNVLREIPKTTLADLVSKVGGALGLFLGFRLLGFIEILEYFIKIITTFCDPMII